MKITLANLHEATAQQVFDQVATHLLTQNKKSVASNGSCAYRGENNTMCAAGCLIADKEYKPEIEHTSWRGIRQYMCISNDHVDLIAELQYIHDAYDPDVWVDQLSSCASKYLLTMPA